MAPSAMATTAAMAAQTISSKAKRPLPPGIQTNGINSSRSSPSPSLSASRLPPGAKIPPGSVIATSGSGASVARAAVNRARRDVPGQLLGRGQRNSSAGLRSASIAGENVVSQSSEPQPYIKSDEYILKKYRGNPPSLIIHMHPTHFRFDQQEGSFSYKSPMKVVIEHLQQRTIPHDLLEFLQDVPFYEGCMIVQVHDHKSSAQKSESVRSTSGTGKTVPFSIHNYNVYITPSSYVPYPSENLSEAKGKDINNGGERLGEAERKGKENMPAPILPGDNSRNTSGIQSKRPKVYTIVLRPTAMSGHVDVVNKILESRLGSDGRKDPRQESGGSGPLSASIPQTPTTATPHTPQNSMAPPAKRLRKAKVELDSNTLYAAESHITLATSAPLVLDLVDDAAGSATLLDTLSHPMHSEKPPSPKARKRTVAEMAADEAQAADQERYMLIMDELRTSKAPGAQGLANPTEGDGQAGGTSFEPRFESFRTIENIRHQHEENKKLEKLRQQENDRKTALDKERQRQREEAEKRDQQQEKARQVQVQIHNSAIRHQQMQEAQRRSAMAGHGPGVPHGLQGVSTQIQGPHAHPQLNGVMSNNMQGQPRFHPQQVSQAQMSSPIVRNGTPHSHSSPTVNNLGNIPMQQSTSSLGGSPPRPASVVNQNQTQMGNQAAHGMAAQRSQQSHTGTPRMPSGTPQVQSTPLSRQISQTTRMNQASPLQGAMAQTPHIPMMVNNQQMPMNMANMNQQQQMQAQQYMAHQRMLQAGQQNPAMQGIRVMSNGQPMNHQQQVMIQQAMLKQHQQQMQQQMQQQGGLNHNIPQMSQNFTQMAPRGQGLPQNMNQSFNPGMPNMQQMQHLQQMQMQQAAQQQMLQGQMQPGQAQHGQAQQTAQIQYNKAVAATTSAMYKNQIPGLIARYGSQANIPSEATNALQMECRKQAILRVNANLRPNGGQNPQQMMAAQAGMQNMNGMPNGMGMQRQ